MSHNPSERKEFFPGKPKYLYRYCSADRALQILRDSAVYLAPPILMNDLIEGTPARLTRYSEEVAHELEIRRYSREGLTRAQAEEFASKNSTEEKKASFKYFCGELRKFAAAMREHSGLAALTEAFNHQKMWGTYGDNHAGACIQFWRDEGKSRVHKHAIPVEYTGDDLTRRLVEGLEENGGASTYLLAELLFTKKTWEWVEEREWRILMVDSKPVPDGERMFTFPVTNVRRVFLGPRMSDRNKAQFHALSKSRNYDWSVIEVMVDPDTAVSSFHGVETNLTLEDFEWHAELALPTKDE